MTKNDSSKPNPHTCGVRHEKRHAYSHAWLRNVTPMGVMRTQGAAALALGCAVQLGFQPVLIHWHPLNLLLSA